VAGVKGLFDRLFGRRPPEPVSTLPAPPTDADLQAAVTGIQQQIGGKVPPAVSARVGRICETVSQTIPRLGELGPGSAQAHSVVSTATSYLPEALGAYLRLPRSFADRRPIDGGRTALMVLIDQLDLLALKMDEIFDAVCRADADALVAHGEFIREELGAGSSLRIAPPELGAGGPLPGSGA
jgi:hypothetical protein